VYLPRNLVLTKLLEIASGDAEHFRQSVWLLHFGVSGLSGLEHDRGNTENHDTEQKLHVFCRHRQPHQSAGNGADRTDKCHRQTELEISYPFSEQRRPGGKRPRKSHEKPRSTDVIDMKWEKTTDDRHEKHAATDTGQHGHNAKQKGEDEKHQHPNPPRRRCNLGSTVGK